MIFFFAALKNTSLASTDIECTEPFMLKRDKQIGTHFNGKNNTESNGIIKEGNKGITHRICRSDNTTDRSCKVNTMISRPNSINMTPQRSSRRKWFQPLMELASPFSPVSPNGDPFLYARVLFSVAKCSANFNKANR